MIDEKYGSRMSVVGHNLDSEAREEETGSGQVPRMLSDAVRWTEVCGAVEPIICLRSHQVDTKPDKRD
jgi:hypothetical protein